MARFHSLDVVDVRKETRDAVVVTLKPRDEDAALFDFTQGQYLTFRRRFDEDELRRSYSICAGKDDGFLQVGIKRVDGGAFSTWANEELRAGATIEAMPPMGRFFTALDPDAARNYLGFAGGSGITPVLSIIKTVLAAEPASTFTLVYANRQISSIMFREELDDLKNRYLGRLSIIHVLESEAQDIDLFTGRVDAAKCGALFKSWIDLPSIDTAFICGPEPMMLAIAGALKEHGLSEEQIKFELFASGQPGRAKKRVVSAEVSTSNSTEATVTLDGATRSFRMPKAGVSLLDAALEANIDAPYACKAGVCSTCRAKVLEGETEMAINHALEDYEVKQGYVLTCQCFPLSDKVVVSYDQ
ncbi:2Fe-2S iron-sulfur cluster-binding protein [Amaricoccus solimangrovi]|uniref:2Fe-2S iron-sulfur cluster binding domain-containing protein n=1 Tax=Amaricoccus solimangrovi TaxID=2589815 RepID=A0A501WQ55_9RHOB|nr:2Fe-2S iron-sulfur cluster-binding protein [Amaricoccus solimangrovi]TPE51913.1 2Fe-2S iron-sulfur cluster binding domain-containing protein [Amaricoccus solimangrovi]